MILLFNVKITNIRLYPGSSPRGHLQKDQDRMDIFKYALASYVPLMPLTSKIILYIDLATTENAGKEDMLEEYIRSIFPNDKIILHFFRNNTQADWQSACTSTIFPVNDPVIMNITNDDHPFIDNGIEIMQEGIQLLSDSEDPYVQLLYSHWPESIRMVNEYDWQLVGKNYARGNFRMITSIDMCRSERWEHYWFSQDLGDHTDYYRPEFLEHRTNMFGSGSMMYAPLKEQVRHFDGYDHAGHCMNTAPPLEIPIGFFDKQIRIAYGYPTRRPGFVNINPASTNLYAYDGQGADYKWALEDIPMFWHKHIAEIDINPDADLEHLREQRDYHLFSTANSPISRFGKPITDFTMFQKYYLSDKCRRISLT
jgi:hypothetical protein